MRRQSNPYDVVIAGGGLVGATLAYGLALNGLSCAVIEQNSRTKPRSAHQELDARPIALSHISRNILAALPWPGPRSEKIQSSLWEQLAPRVTAIHNIHVSDQQGLGIARLNYTDEALPGLGYIVTYHDLMEVLYTALGQMPLINLICPAQVTAIKVDHTAAQLTLKQGGNYKKLTALLVVGADGNPSFVSQHCGMQHKQFHYRQNAIATTLAVQRPHFNTAYERFTAQGPLAFLPLSGQRYGLILCHSASQTDTLIKMTDAQFLQYSHSQFGHYLGRFLQCGPRQCFPLSLQYIVDPVRPRLMVMGNAAHTLHPIAGQGFNLALRGVAHLLEILTHAHRQGEDIGAESLLKKYSEKHHLDVQRAIGFTHDLVSLFSTTNPVLTWIRNTGLQFLDTSKPLKHLLAKTAQGFRPGLAPLSRGMLPEIFLQKENHET